MRAPFSHPVSGLPTQGTPVPTQAGQPPPPPGFDAWLAIAMAEETRAGEALATGPADFGLWGVAPDADGRLDLDAVAANLHATLPACAGNLGKSCRAAGLPLPPAIRLRIGADGMLSLAGDPREATVLAALAELPGLDSQCRRLLAGFSFVRCGDGLRAWQRAMGQLGPSRLSLLLAQHGDGSAAPALSLCFDGQRAWPEEAQGIGWRPLAGLTELAAELLRGAHAPGAHYREHRLAIDQAFDPINAKLRAARAR